MRAVCFQALLKIPEAEKESRVKSILKRTGLEGWVPLVSLPYPMPYPLLVWLKDRCVGSPVRCGPYPNP